MFHVNVRSLNANFNKLITFLNSLSFNFDVISLSEIWSTNISYYSNLLPTHDFFYVLPLNKAGGVGMYISKKLNPKVTLKYLPPPSPHQLQCYKSLWVEIQSDTYSIVIGCFYRHPNSPITLFTENFLFSLDKLKNVKYCYIFGDFNISLSNYSTNNLTRAYVDSVLDAKFLPYIYLPTRITDHSSTIIDHVYSNDLFTENYICKTGLIISEIADHCSKFMFLIDNDPKLSKNHIVERTTIRNYSRVNLDKFNNFLAAADWSSVLSCSDPNVSLDRFLKIFTGIHDNCFTLINIKN